MSQDNPLLPYPQLDPAYIKLDKEYIRRTKNIRLIPEFKNRRGGKASYAEWGHVIGIFQTLIYQNLIKKTGSNILDIGCGTGLLGISSEPFIYDGGMYTGLDVRKDDIDFCKDHYKLSNYNFVHFNVSNPFFASEQSAEKIPWPVADESQDMITALSVWTHLNEIDAMYYFNEIFRVLKKGSRAIITFFFLDNLYEESLKRRSDGTGRFHLTNQKNWIFSKKAYDSKNWYALDGVKIPENAIGVTPAGVETLLEQSGLKLLQYNPGNWKEMPGIFFQDVLVFEK